MGKIGRNQHCPCGSGKKFKRCHGALASTSHLPANLPDPIRAQVEASMKKIQAQIFQRVRQQGQGKPIISTEMNGTRFVAIGNRIAQGKWLTFPDFLIYYLKAIFGFEWGQSELAKPNEEQHPLFQWLAVLANLQKKHFTHAGAINKMPEYGAARATYGLAYDIYLIEHHIQNQTDRNAFERLLKRLRHKDQFFGARHEAKGAGIVLRAGFNLAWEEEEKGRLGGYGEFVATFPETKRSFWIECKMRQSEDDSSPARFTHLISDALQKTTDLERLVFVELNLPNGRMDKEQGGWVNWATNQLRLLETQPNASKLPPALILISNSPEHRQLDQLPEGAGAFLEGFKTGNRYRIGEAVDLFEAIEESERNPEIEALWRSLKEHSTIPTTFDGSLPGLDESQRLIIGQSYELDAGEIGVLESATVVEAWRQSACVLRLSDGRRVICKFDLSDDEMQAWQRHPETFFGELQPHHPPADTPKDVFDFFANVYAETPKDKLLEFMAEHPDIEELRGLPQPEIVRRYAYRLAVTIAQRGKPPTIPAWYGRLRRRKMLERERP